MPKGQALYYDPPPVIKEVPDVVVKRVDTRADYYTGSADALVQAGLARPDMFPGQPGRSLAMASYRPSGVDKAAGDSWLWTPGYMTIYRNPSGNFRIQLTVSIEEQTRRKQAEKAASEARRARNAPESTRTTDTDRARRNLAEMPNSVAAYHQYLAGIVRSLVCISIDTTAKPASWHGYTVDEESVADIKASADAIIEAIVRANIRFDAARHASIAQGYRAQIAAADSTFQAQFASLVRPNPALLAGSAS